jgi:hypothetical protein
MVTCQREIKKFIGEVERLGSPCSLYKDWHHSLFSDGAPGREEAAISLSVSSSCPPFSKWQQHNMVSMLNTTGLEIPLPQQGAGRGSITETRAVALEPCIDEDGEATRSGSGASGWSSSRPWAAAPASPPCLHPRRRLIPTDLAVRLW